MNHRLFPRKESLVRNESNVQTSERVIASFLNLASTETTHRCFDSKHRLKPRFDQKVSYHPRMPRAMRIDPDAARFGAILKQLREQRGWTRQKLAQRAGFTPTYIGILEYGGNIPSLPTVLELIEVLGADIGDVMRRLAAARISPPAVLPPERPAES